MSIMMKDHLISGSVPVQERNASTPRWHPVLSAVQLARRPPAHLLVSFIHGSLQIPRVALNPYEEGVVKQRSGWFPMATAVVPIAGGSKVRAVVAMAYQEPVTGS
jgi:hypothetical protein